MIDRRTVLGAAAFGAMPGGAAIARAPARTFRLEPGGRGLKTFAAVHAGLGSIDVRLFNFAGASAPANFLIYDIPPGASEGVHVHNLTDPKLGAFDEYYYVIEGLGRMTIDGRPVPVVAGDHVHTPLEVAHGIENIHPRRRLKVFLTYIDRTGSPA